MSLPEGLQIGHWASQGSSKVREGRVEVSKNWGPFLAVLTMRNNVGLTWWPAVFGNSHVDGFTIGGSMLA